MKTGEQISFHDIKHNNVWYIVKIGFFIFYGGKVKLPAFFNTQKAQLPL